MSPVAVSQQVLIALQLDNMFSTYPACSRGETCIEYIYRYKRNKKFPCVWLKVCNLVPVLTHRSRCFDDQQQQYGIRLSTTTRYATPGPRPPVHLTQFAQKERIMMSSSGMIQQQQQQPYMMGDSTTTTLNPNNHQPNATTTTAATTIAIDTQHEDLVHDSQMDFYGSKLATCSSGTCNVLGFGSM